MAKESTIIYRSFYEAIKELPEKNQCEVWNAIFQFALDETEVELGGISKTVFRLIKPQIEANNRRYKNGCKDKKSDKKKAKRKRNGSETEANNKQTRSETDSRLSFARNDNDNVNVNVNDKEKIKGEIIKSLSGNGSTPEEVEKVATEQVAEFEKEFQTLKTWITNNTPRVNQMKEPLTLQQFVYLRHKIPDKQKLRDLLFSMHNWKDLTVKNVSAYLTILKWAKNVS